MLVVSQMKENCVSGVCLSKGPPDCYYPLPPSDVVFPSAAPERTSPLPTLSWTSSEHMWRQMRLKDVVKCTPEADLQLRHPGIVPSMRVILLDWMLEVRTMYTYTYT